MLDESFRPFLGPSGFTQYVSIKTEDLTSQLVGLAYIGFSRNSMLEI